MLTRAEWIPRLGDEPVTAIWGIGNRTAARLAELGIVTVEDLARADTDELAAHFGPTIGPHLRILGLGGDDAPLVDEPHVAKGRSREETFTTDVADRRRSPSTSTGWRARSPSRSSPRGGGSPTSR